MAKNYEQILQACFDNTSALNIVTSPLSPTFDSTTSSERVRIVQDNDMCLQIAKGEIAGHSYINKFGLNPAVGSSYEDVWSQGASYTFLDTAQTLYLSSSAAADIIEMTVIGLDANWVEQTQTVDLTGQSQVEIGSGLTWIRIFRAFNSDATGLAGDVYVAETDSLSSGVPQTATKIKGKVTKEEQQTEMAIYSIPAGKTAYLYDLYINSGKGTDSQGQLEIRSFGKVFLVKHHADEFEGSYNKRFCIPDMILEKSDVKISAKTTAQGGRVSAGFDIVLVDN